LLPLVYEELRRLAAHQLAAERPGHTLQPTALVHEAYLRLAGGAGGADEPRGWHGRAHFFAAAAEAMRRILIDSARRRSAARHGGECRRVEFDDTFATATVPGAAAATDDLIALDAALARLEAEDKPKADLVKLHYFVGLSLDEAADALGVSRATAYRHWTYARA
jgi:RNA polymerase sigma factor (TIGR02999 family)